MDLSDFITSSKALMDFFLPTKRGVTMDGKITISLSGKSGFELLEVIGYEYGNLKSYFK